MKLQAVMSEREVINLHGSQAFDATTLSSTTRRVLRLGGTTLSAAGTVNGLTVHEVDALIERAGAACGMPLTTQETLAVKLELRAKKILL